MGSERWIRGGRVCVCVCVYVCVYLCVCVCVCVCVGCLLYICDAADEERGVETGGPGINKKNIVNRVTLFCYYRYRQLY